MGRKVWEKMITNYNMTSELNNQMMKKIDSEKVAFFRFKKFPGKNGKYLLTNDVGEFIFLNRKSFLKYLSGELPESNQDYLKLKQKSFIRNYLNFQELIKRYKEKSPAMLNGPSLHIVVTTLRCNHKCLYCHASAVSAENGKYDMSIETAKKTVDKIFESPSQSLNIEFQGGEPLLNWSVVKFIIEYARAQNRKKGKQLSFNLISNFSLLNDVRLNFLIRNKVSVCTSLDGPEFIHNRNRIFIDGSSHNNTTRWLKKTIAAYKKNYPEALPAALTTITRYSLPYHKEIIDEYLSLKLSAVYLRPLNPFGFAKDTWKKIGYTADEFINFYRKSLDYIILQNIRGKKIREVLASTFLVKILTNSDPNHMDYRSPCGAGIGQLAYNYNGDVYTCDEGRMFSQMNDDSFKIGTINNKYDTLMDSPVVKAMCVASCTDTLPGCSDCVYKPYCGVCPVYNYSEQGNIFGHMPSNDRCKILKAVFDHLFSMIENKEIIPIFHNWLGNYKNNLKK